MSQTSSSHKTNWEKLKTLTDADIALSVANDSEAVPLDLDWSKADIIMPKQKEIISIRLDDDVLTFFKQQGRGYQTKINAVLRSFMQAQVQKSS
jgi:uncharacterized protein (DUF4415 family)